MIRYQDIEITADEIEACKKEYFETHTYHGTDRPVVLDDKTAKYVLNGRKYHEAFLNAVHPSHDMTEWESKIMAPSGTERFYAYRQCKNCEYEHYHHPAGKFLDHQLEVECNAGEVAQSGRARG